MDILSALNDIANDLDSSGYIKEADMITSAMTRLSNHHILMEEIDPETGRRLYDNQGNDMPDVLPEWADSDEEYLAEMDNQRAEMERLLPLYRAERKLTEGYEPHELDPRWIQDNLK